MGRETKMVIVIRRDLKMRRGKEIAQGAHASQMWLLDRAAAGNVVLTDAERAWIEGGTRKICVTVNSLEELLVICLRAEAAGITTGLVEDAGDTEFGGVPTVTVCAVGPGWSDLIDPITGDLKLY